MADTIHLSPQQPEWHVKSYVDLESLPETGGDFLLYRHDFIRHKAYPALRTFDLYHGPVCHMRILFAREAKGWKSLPQVPFAGPVTLQSPVPEQVLTDYLAFCGRTLANDAEVTITLPPSGYTQNHYLTVSALEKGGFSLAEELTSHHVVLRDYTGNDLHPMQRRKLRKSDALTFRVEESANACLELIRQFREERDHHMSMDIPSLLDAFGLFPDSYYLFSVRKGGDILSLLVAVRISPEVLYYFMPANAPGSEPYSPSVYMIHNVAAWARQKGFRILDLGPSLEPDTKGGKQPKESLALFKKRMGGIPSLRQTFRF